MAAKQSKNIGERYPNWSWNLICPKKVIKFNCALKFHTTEPGVKKLTRLNCVTKMKVKSSEIFKNKVIDLANTFMCKIQPKDRQTLEDTQKLTWRQVWKFLTQCNKILPYLQVGKMTSPFFQILNTLFFLVEYYLVSLFFIFWDLRVILCRCNLINQWSGKKKKTTSIILTYGLTKHIFIIDTVFIVGFRKRTQWDLHSFHLLVFN